jgi:hypothetical protein
MAVIIGLIDISFHENQKDPGLLNDSYYRSISHGLSEMRERKQDPSKFTSIAKNSSQLVPAIEKDASGKVHIGTLSWPDFKYLQ